MKMDVVVDTKQSGKREEKDERKNKYDFHVGKGERLFLSLDRFYAFVPSHLSSSIFTEKADSPKRKVYFYTSRFIQPDLRTHFLLL